MLCATAPSDELIGSEIANPVGTIRNLLDQPDAQLDFLEAKLELDVIIEPGLDARSRTTRLIGCAPPP